MLKEAIICVVIIVSIVFGNAKTQNYTKESVSELSSELTVLRDEISKGEGEINEDVVKEKVNGIYETWKNKIMGRIKKFFGKEEKNNDNR